MHKLFQMVLLFFIVTNSVAGTTGKIVGMITDWRTNEGLEAVNVYIEGLPLGSASDENGFYFILNVPPGEYNIIATFVGYGSITKTNVRVKIDQTTEVNFELTEQIMRGEEIIVTAEKPPVELDLTASKQSVTADEINNHWGTTLEQAISDIPGININGGVRGGYGLHEVYQLDGMDMRDVGSNTNFKSINLSTVQEVEVLTGGYNAEYGQANGAIMNIVTKSATDGIHGSVSYRVRPAGKYHWGSNVYGPNTFQRTIMTTTEFWDPNSTWQTKWMSQPHSGYSGDVEPFVSMTPAQRAVWWTQFVNDRDFNYQMDYAERMQWETEATIYGPITPELGFMFSGRYMEGVSRYPSALKFNPDMTFQGTLSWRLNPRTKIDFNLVYTQFENSGNSRTNYTSTEDTFHDDSRFPYVRDPYNQFTYWLWGFYSSSNFQMRGPEYTNFANFQGKITHTFSAKTYMNIAIQHSQMDYSMNFRDVLKSSFYSDLGFDAVPDKYPVSSLPQWKINYRWANPGDIWRNDINTMNTSFKTDITSQYTENHQFKIGGLFSYQMFDKVLHDSQGDQNQLEGHLTDLSETTSYPYEGAFYIQDKMEFEGLVVNAGLRFDFFNANKTVSANPYDPLMISDSTVGNDGTIGHISFDPNGSGPGYVKTKTQWAFAPRIGISHPITERTVLHFMYGKFYQRPPWQKISGPVVVRTLLPTAEEGGTSYLNIDPDSALVYYNFYTHANPNPALTYEKMTQWEVGIKQNISDFFDFDLTFYYRSAHDLTSQGINQGPNSLNVSKAGNPLFVEMHGDPNLADGRIYGRYIGFFETFVNGSWAKVNGIESTLRYSDKYLNIAANYTLSFLTSGVYHYDEVYQYFEDNNFYVGAGNRDDGRNGIDDDSWQPQNAAYLKVAFQAPKDFGPSLAGIHPFANWSIYTSTTWAQGQRFTYYPSDVPSGEQASNNKRWKDKWKTNMSLVYRFHLMNGIAAKFSAQITNLFNQKHLRLPSSEEDRTRYFEEGKLPEDDLTREPLKWLWYTNSPREVYLGISLEF